MFGVPTAFRGLRTLSATRLLHRAIPPTPYDISVDTSKLPKPTKIDRETILQLERVALVDFATEEGIRRLEAAVQLADTIAAVDTKGVQPLYTVLEDRSLYLEKDEVTDGNCKKEVLANASKTEEDYFVAPPGNIPLDQTDKK
ncbi:glutamyl-tRNA(Gln) amidotransferase subunit C, mitochondrial [Neocloeon triangulifer]|uniref:glutamyl-tRNA(Gln) amidotransferase subunit C, mitochondrial n=1 Tax=Neocloeon triangulifer TaxID=2078957 RepID=UPI00286F21B0|nr:glutamyl-tRNA(Gln) amidotransferase subunit C, mitochondrial [Neocloeon triangulifer]